MNFIALLGLLWLVNPAYGYEAIVTKGEMPPVLSELLTKANNETNLNFSPDDFIQIEERILATSKFTMYVQSNSMVPVDGTAVRIWSDLKTNELIRAEMHLDEKALNQKDLLINRYTKARFTPKAMKSKQLADSISEIVKKVVSQHDSDAKIFGLKFKDQWQGGDLVRVVEVRGRRGIHTISISLLKNKILQTTYREFMQSESMSLHAHVYQVYEEVEGTGERLNPEVKELKYLSTRVPVGGENPFGHLSKMEFLDTNYSVILAGTPLGEMLGLWSETSVRNKIENFVQTLPKADNNFKNGILLQGKYATINLHPSLKDSVKGVELPLNSTTNHLMKWVLTNGYNGKVVHGLEGKRITSEEELMGRIPFRHPEHDLTTYINSGFDEVQVYYGVTTLMESLVQMGFTDPELSEKPFHAFLFDPDISMKDNAYYYDNTINFTTYNPGTPNLARDNPTIWHELGHAIMERLMGVHLNFDAQGGYGGLSEGMADFLAQIVLEHQTEGAMFPGKENMRILNDIGFDLTNEFHDEGEAYGGAMNDMLLTVNSYEGEDGLHAFTDLTLEAMRLARNHPKLNAAKWFDLMLYADSLGSSIRPAGKYRDLIEGALVSRNFSFDPAFKAAQMEVKFGNTVLTELSPGSRSLPMKACDRSGIVSFDLNLSLKGGDSNFITFPAIVKVEYQKGALQGAIKWLGEETNPHTYIVNSEAEMLSVPLKAYVECESVNRPNGACRDYAYLQVYNEGITKPVAKKRFYLELGKVNCSKD